MPAQSQPETSRQQRRWIIQSVFLVSACALAYEVLLMRLMSIILWHHFAYLVIGLALLGYGLSGTLVSLFQEKLLDHFDHVFALALALFGVSSIAAFDLAQRIPFNAELMLWDPAQSGYLALMFLLLMLPFLFAASAVCLAFLRLRQSTARIYGADLVGAGGGSLLVVSLLFLLSPVQLLILIGCTPLTLAAIYLAAHAGIAAFLKLATIAAIPLLLLYGQQLELQVSPYKSLSQSLQINGASVVAQRSSPLGLLQVVENPRLPFRIAPGLSLTSRQALPEQKALFIDAGQAQEINRFPEDPQQLSYLDDMTPALAFHLMKPDRVLIAGGQSRDVLRAIYHRVPRIEVLQRNRQIIELFDQRFAEFSGAIFNRPDTHVHNHDLREHLQLATQRYPLIQLPLDDAASGQLQGLLESYPYTVEAFELYLSRLQPGGLLSVTGGITLPPRGALKLLNTVATAMRNLEISDIDQRVGLIRSWQTYTLLVKNGQFTDLEIAAMRDFSRQRSFDVAWYPGITPGETNRYNRLSTAAFHEAALNLLGNDARAYIDRYKFRLEAPTDNQPYFSFYLKWRSLQELFNLRERGSMPLMEWGYLVLLATLLISTVLSIVLILLPLLVTRRTITTQRDTVHRTDLAVYFIAIGLAFLMVEIVFIQKFTLFLFHPIYSVALTLAAFLVFAGSGSLAAQRLQLRIGCGRLLLVGVVGIVALSLLYILALDSVFARFAGDGLGVRALACVALIAPLAFLMGLPFPLALSSVAEHAPRLIPWAWGINGCASVVSASLSTLLAVHFGFELVMLLALALYLLTIGFFPKPRTSTLST